jgi:uncharacterized DUF497 family protein
MQFSGFDWDEGNRTKCRKHGVPPDGVESLFQKNVLMLPDDAHSREERRFRAIGRDAKDRAIFVVFTLRRRGGDMLIRPISARYMHKKESEHYEKNYGS